MQLNFRNLPIGNLPYNDIQLCKQMMLRLFENLPYNAELPLLDMNDNVVDKTFMDIPNIQIKDGILLLPEENDEVVFKVTDYFDSIFNSTDPNDFLDYIIDTPYLHLYSEMLKRIKPNYTVVNVIGPFSFANLIFNRNAATLLNDKRFRHLLINIPTIKALAYIYKIKELSPDTKPIIIFEENLLYKFGTLKRINDSINKETVTTLFLKVFQRIKKAGGIVCVQSFQKCNWQLVLETDAVDIISFDAYNTPNNLNIIAPSVNKFLAKGGIINWGIVPVMNEAIIRALNFDIVYGRFISTVDNLAAEGISSDLLYKNATVSVQGNMSNLPIISAEKALILCHQLSKRIG